MTETRLSEKDAEIFRELLSRDRICIYMHRSPDGDTLGSALALEKVLKNAGKRVCIACSDLVPRRLRFITDGVSAFEPAFEPLVKVSIDVASEKLLGERYENEASTFDFCIDHHYTNTHYAKKTVVCPEASSAGEVLFMLLEQTGTPIDGKTAECTPADPYRGGKTAFFRDRFRGYKQKTVRCRADEAASARKDRHRQYPRISRRKGIALLHNAGHA